MPTKNSDFLRDALYDQVFRNHNAVCHFCGNLIESEEESHFLCDRCASEYDRAFMS
jgi:tRNA(Ile2) C34 agmatinyltransferase TiaS